MGKISKGQRQLLILMRRKPHSLKRKRHGTGEEAESKTLVGKL